MPQTPIQSPFAIAIERVTLLVGFTALLLPVIPWLTSTFGMACDFDSISHYYYSRFGSDWFVGSLCFIGLLMMFLYVIRPGEPGFEGFKPRDKWIMKGAGLAAFLIAFFPTAGTGCDEIAGQALRIFAEFPADINSADLKPARQAWSIPELSALTSIPDATKLSFSFFALLGDQTTLDGMLHNGGAVAMFAALGYFSLFVFTRRQDVTALRAGIEAQAAPKGTLAAFRSFTPRKQLRNLIYVVAGVLIFGCILALIVKSLSFGCDRTPAGDLCKRWNRVDATFTVEWIALWAFAASWLVKGRVIPWLRDPPQG